MRALRGLYPIVDLGVLDPKGIDAVRFAEAVLTADPALLQLRAKYAEDTRILSLAKLLRSLCEARGTTFVLNDRPDLAAKAGVHFVHLGQGDMGADELRARYPDLAFGLSTHTEEQLGLALREAPAYVAYGPVFATKTKENPDATVGLAQLRAAHETARAAGIPLVAIGGIDSGQLANVAELADLVAVISALVPGGVAGEAFFAEVGARVQGFQKTLGTLAGVAEVSR